MAANLCGLSDDRPEPVEIPHAQLSEEALWGLIEEFVTRDGTDYGASERSLESKAAAVLRRLERGEAKVVFDPQTGTPNIVTAV